MQPEPDVYRKRAERLRSLAEADYLIILDESNIRYLTGFTGGDGALLLGPVWMTLLVDGRYITQAGLETKNLEISEFKNRTEVISAVFQERGASCIGFESSAVSYGEYLRLRDSLPQATLQPLGSSLDLLRAVKDDAEVGEIKKAIRVAEKALTDVISLIKPGVTEAELAVELEYRMRRGGAERMSFETIVATGPDAALPHAAPGKRRIADGDFVLIDYGAVVNGYHSDETRTFCVGSPSPKQREAYQFVMEAHDRALGAIRAGVSCGEIDGVARSFLAEKGLDRYFSHGAGHGVGLAIHEPPRLSTGRADILEVGMVVTVEPGVYFPGEWGIRIEDMALVGKDSCEVLTTPGVGLVEL
ncbi:MAG: Xaa-Pro peptidase family protein [Syntrophales bacterium]|jgi:Xaa-Pro aminopeptidase/Xaa-Pro dipeptidase|nr:Xaa-Pro peptidase family protein [Syntrophales bacterium]